MNADEASYFTGFHSWWKRLWLLNLPNKIKIFCWKACKEILPTKLLLFKRNIMGPAVCELCGNQVESVDHALGSCKKIQQQWKTSSLFDVLKRLVNINFVDRLLHVVGFGGQ
ncbi:hypothetical protein LWI29_011234 [Acer saccharum]|uniref:Reverse transcriptase zinc-binding domain-containing protein n=1 Tax=Acer saccharum TaxID=4024 RepID=A0AA39SX92_ACESA|nr:hypothetical protein LWI29_011234 [Acer saccharum]